MPTPPLPPVEPGQVWEVLFQGTLNNGTTLCYNTMKWRVEAIDPMAPIPDKTRRDFLAAMETRWRNFLIPLVCSTYQLRRVLLHCITSVTPRVGAPTQPAIHYSEAVAIVEDPVIPGGVAAEVNPDFVAIHLKADVGVVGRHWRGGMHIGGVPDASVAGQSLAVLDLPLWQAFATAMIAQSTPAGDNARFIAVTFAGQLAINQPLGITYTGAATYARDITFMAVDERAGTMLHRKLRPAN